MNSYDKKEVLEKGCAKRIRALRTALQLSQNEFASHIGVGHTAVSNWEKTEGKNPSLEQLGRISQVYNVSMDWLWLGRKDCLSKEMHALIYTGKDKAVGKK